MKATCCIHELALYDAGKVVLYVPDDLNPQLHEGRIISAPRTSQSVDFNPVRHSVNEW